MEKNMALAGIEIDLIEARQITDHSHFRYERQGKIDDREIEQQPANWPILVKWNCPRISPIVSDPVLKTRKQELGSLIGIMVSDNFTENADAAKRRQIIRTFVSIYLGVKSNPANDKKMGHNLSRFFAVVDSGEPRTQVTTGLLCSAEKVLR